MDAEAVADDFFDTLTAIAESESSPNDLALLMKNVEDTFDGDYIKYRNFLEEVFPDVICEAVNEIVNDSEWRSDEIGSNAISDPDTLRDLYPILCGIDQNVEVVFATNPHIPLDITQILSESDYEWEEDGTTSALARNTSNQAILRELSNSPDPSTRFSVALNTNTPRDVLDILSQDEGFSRHRLYLSFDGGWQGQNSIEVGYIRCSIKFAVLSNSNTSIETIEKIAGNNRNLQLDSEYEFLGISASQVNQALQHEASRILERRNDNFK